VLFYRRVQGKEPRTGSLIDELGLREAAARAEADRLRIRIEELPEDLARAGKQASRLAIALEEVARVLEEPAAEESPARQDGRPTGRGTSLADRGGDGAAVAGGWRRAGAAPDSSGPAGGDGGRGPAAAGGAVRGHGRAATEKAKVEGLRSRLKLLAARHRRSQPYITTLPCPWCRGHWRLPRPAGRSHRRGLGWLIL
jgi:hypothetical protein